MKDLCRDLTVTNTKFEFRNGKVENYVAATNGNCFPETMAPYTGPKDSLGTVSIGLNPEMKVMHEGKANFAPQQAAGMVFIGLGENRFYGGTNHPSGGGYGFAITNATVTVDGTTIIKDGKLVK